MNRQEPVFTEKAECQDCYKCVRNCPVKAIQVQDGSAMVIADRCIACGTCVKVCPVGAKHVRNDLDMAKELVASGKDVYVSLAPSYASEFRINRPEQFICALRRLGFKGVSETALGAQLVSAEVASKLKKDRTPMLYLSSACPAVVELVTKYIPEHADDVTTIASPVIAHARLLRKHYGQDIGIVFVSPCVAKKLEADAYPELLDVAITFADLRAWLEEEQIPLAGLATGSEDRFLPEAAHCGALYPIDGGMITGIRACGAGDSADFVALSGIDTIRRGLEGLRPQSLNRPLFAELLACEGGCINGPKGSDQTGTILKRNRVEQYAKPGQSADVPPDVDMELPLAAEPIEEKQFSEHEILEALREVGKHSPHDELNCGGCGYDNCRAFSRALLAGSAERTMCVSYMRKLAQNKANALMRSMPSGVVLVDEDLKIVECNAKFARLMGEEVEMIFRAKPGMEGAELARVAPFANLFEHALRAGTQTWEKDVRIGRTILHLVLFTVEPHRLVGAILQDITEPVVQKEHVIEKATEVMRKNLATVQQIAYLLGENAADSEGILNSIIQSFRPDDVEDAAQARPDQQSSG